MKYKIICHKDLCQVGRVYHLIKNYEQITGTCFLETANLKKFNYKIFIEYLLAYGRTTQWWASNYRKKNSSPFAKVKWPELIPIVMEKKDCDRQKAIDTLEFILSEMTVANNELRKDFFFFLYTKGEDYLNFEYDLIQEDITDFAFFNEKITEDGVRPKYHPEKFSFMEDETYLMKVPSTSLVFSKEDAEEIEELIQSRIVLSDNDEEIEFLLKFSKRLGLGILK